MSLRAKPVSRNILGILALGASLVACNKGNHGVDTNDPPDSDDTGVGNLEVQPCDWDFGLVEIGSLTSRSYSAANRGGQDITIDAISIGSPFTVSATTPLTISGDSSYQFSIRFEPENYGEFEEQLVITSDDEDQSELICTVKGQVLTDADADGYDSVAAGGDDCDDNEANVHPGAEENWYDGTDANCSGGSDFDQDGDGYESKVYNPDPEEFGGDCQDVNPNIHPGADDAFYDGIDSDCGGENDYDQDGDGFKSAVYGGTDCDDTDPAVFPDAPEAFNRADDDCDGVVDDSASADEADAVLVGDDGDDHAGRSVAVGDFDGSGDYDLAVGIYLDNYDEGTVFEGDGQGAVAIYLDGDFASGDAMSDADIYIAGDDAHGEFGYSVSLIGDYDDDGTDDLAVGATGYGGTSSDGQKGGRVYIFSGADLSSTTAASDAIATFDGDDDFRMGANIAEGQDLNGDGVSDLVAYGRTSYDPSITMMVQYGSSVGAYAWADIDATWKIKCGTASSSSHTCGPLGSTTGESGGTSTWEYMAHGWADLDGDGLGDLVQGDKYDDEGDYANGGRVYILWGRSGDYNPSNGSLSGSGTVIAEGTSVHDNVGAAVGPAPDEDGDDDNELWIQRGKAEALYYINGGADLRLGTLDLDADAAATFDLGDEVISGITMPGDWTGDGDDDLAMGFGHEGGGGSLWLWESKAWTGAGMSASANLTGSIEGGADGDNFGISAVLVAKDLNGDGMPDLVVGDAGYDSGGGAEGAVYVFYNPY